MKKEQTLIEKYLQQLENGEMPCGSNHSCRDCIHSVLTTQPCTYLSRLSEGEVDYFMDKLKEKV